MVACSHVSGSGRREGNAALLSHSSPFRLLLQSRTIAHGMVLRTFRIALPLSVKPLRHTLKDMCKPLLADNLRVS